jgi:hypothetical protein
MKTWNDKTTLIGDVLCKFVPPPPAPPRPALLPPPHRGGGVILLISLFSLASVPPCMRDARCPT